jgi:hypothetical protein
MPLVLIVCVSGALQCTAPWDPLPQKGEAIINTSEWQALGFQGQQWHSKFEPAASCHASLLPLSAQSSIAVHVWRSKISAG